VSIIALPGGVLRLACNRDELWTRPAAMPPRLMQFGARQAVLPIDPQSNGTWVAENDAGLMCAVLNARRGWVSNRAPLSLRSRGEIIPSLLHCSTITEAIEAAGGLEATRHGPFRLLMIDRSGGAEILSDGRRVARRSWSLEWLPLMFTSSGLGDELVESPRRELFDHMVTFGECSRESQDAFHRHAWPDRQYLSVCMRRNDAGTRSYTVIETWGDAASIRYRAGAPDGAAVQPEPVHI